MKWTALVSLAVIVPSASAFHFGQMESRRILSSSSSSSTSQLQASPAHQEDSRRAFFGKSASAALALASSSGLGVGVLAPQPANAVGGVKKVSEQLKA